MPSGPSENMNIELGFWQIVYYLSLLIEVLNPNELSAYIDHFIHPVVLDRVVHCGSSAILFNVGAHTLVNSPGIPRKMIDNPKVDSL